MTIIQYVLTIIIGVVAVLLARETHITSTDAGRLLPVTMRLLSACIAGYALHNILGMALGPVPFTVFRRQPAMHADSHSAYRMQFGVQRVVMA